MALSIKYMLQNSIRLHLKNLSGCIDNALLKTDIVLIYFKFMWRFTCIHRRSTSFFTSCMEHFELSRVLGGFSKVVAPPLMKSQAPETWMAY